MADMPTTSTSQPLKKTKPKHGFLHRHSLSIAAILILLSWIVPYMVSDPSSHIGSFYGNAIADWSGVVVTILATKYLYEKDSAESRRLPKTMLRPALEWLRDHSLSIFLLLTGMGWVALYIKMDPNAKWGQVVGNIVSEWTQIFGLVVMTKHFLELHSKESRE